VKSSRRSKRLTDRRALAALATLAFLAATPCAADEVSANRSETRLDGDATTRTYAGDVSATLRQTHITADSAVVDSRTDQYTFYRSVRFKDDRYLVYADNAVYDVAEKVAVLSGQVRLSDGDQTLSAGHITYSAVKEQFEARDRVQMRLADGVSISTDSWFRDVSADTSVGEGNVGFTRDTSAVFRINAHRVLVKDSGEWLQFTRRVKMQQGTWTAEADTAVYDRLASKLLMIPNGKLSRYSETPGVLDSTSAQGLETRIQMRDGRIDQINLAGAVQLAVVRSDAQGRSTSMVTSDTAVVDVRDEEVSFVRVRGKVLLQLHSAEALSTRLAAESTQITFESGVPAQIRVDGKGHLTYGTEADSLQADISGYGMTVTFQEARIHRVEVDSNAVCEIDGTQPIHLTGEHLILQLSGQSLTSAEVKGAVQGRYKGVGSQP